MGRKSIAATLLSTAALNVNCSLASCVRVVPQPFDETPNPIVMHAKTSRLNLHAAPTQRKLTAICGEIRLVWGRGGEVRTLCIVG
jgi:hypothetical protein